MPIDSERFEKVAAQWGRHSSWAVWQVVGSDEPPKAGTGDLEVLNPDKNPRLLETLNPEVVMLGLNAATRLLPPGRWSNFHDPRPVANDFKIRFAFAETDYWGAYMTDLLVDFHQTDSRQVSSYMKAYPDKVALQVARLEEELDGIGAVDPLLIAFGGLAHGAAQKALGHRYRVIKVPHYSNWTAKEAYRQRVEQAIEAGLKLSR